MASITLLDWSIVALYFLITLALGLAFRKRGERSVADYFVSGRSLPWWLAGTSMVATTFAADTPLAVSSIVAREGISGNWVWWAYLPGGLATVFFFAALWRRAGVITDVELVTLRYSGRAASCLRGFRAVYLGVVMNGIVMGWVNLAMAKILSHVLAVDQWVALGLCLLVTTLYATASGLWGIVVTDAVQFVVGMIGTIALAAFAFQAVGGLPGLLEKLAAAPHPSPPAGSDGGAPWGGKPYGEATHLLSFLPNEAAWTLPTLTFAVYLAVNWWSSWYPGAEPGGGGYVAQRLFATRNERHAILAGLWFNVAHYALRPWPWILAGLCGIALYGNTLAGPDGRPDPALNYVQLIVKELPPGWTGLLLAAFAAAYMSTISTQLNWGASYLINDLYQPFLSRGAEPRHAVRAGRFTTLGILVLSLVITRFMGTIEGAWKFLLSLGAGTGLVLILRWYWWRVNAWSEIASMVAALVTSTLLFSVGHLNPDSHRGFATIVLVTLGVTTITWVLVTLLTPPESPATLTAFCRRVRPVGPGWRRVHPGAGSLDLGARLGAWAVACILVYGALFGIGSLLLGNGRLAALNLGAAVLAALALSRLLRHPAFHGPPPGREEAEARRN